MATAFWEATYGPPVTVEADCDGRHMSFFSEVASGSRFLGVGKHPCCGSCSGWSF